MEMTPLILAASAGHDKVVNLLLNHRANNERYAASKNWKSICVALLEKGVDINVTDTHGATPIEWSASKGNFAIIKLLLDYGNQLKVDQRDAYGNSALHLACEEDRKEEAKFLVEHGASVELTNEKRKTSLDLCNPILVRQLKEMSEKMS